MINVSYSHAYNAVEYLLEDYPKISGIVTVSFGRLPSSPKINLYVEKGDIYIHKLNPTVLDVFTVDVFGDLMQYKSVQREENNVA